MPGELIVAEPKGRYAARPPLVADCSVLAAILFEPERDTAAMALAGRDLFSPDLVDHHTAAHHTAFDRYLLGVRPSATVEGRHSAARHALDVSASTVQTPGPP